MLQERDEIFEDTIKGLVNKVKTRQIRVTDLIASFIERIEKVDVKINSLISVFFKSGSFMGSGQLFSLNIFIVSK